MRLCWYGDIAIMSTASATPTAAAADSTLAGAPPMNTIANAIATTIDAVPRSGSVTMSAASSAVTSAIGLSPSTLRVIRGSRATMLAIHMISARASQPPTAAAETRR